MKHGMHGTMYPKKSMAKSYKADSLKGMKGYARSEGAGTRPGENAYIEKRMVGKGPYTPR